MESSLIDNKGINVVYNYVNLIKITFNIKYVSS